MRPRPVISCLDEAEANCCCHYMYALTIGRYFVVRTIMGSPLPVPAGLTQSDGPTARPAVTRVATLFHGSGPWQRGPWILKIAMGCDGFIAPPHIFYALPHATQISAAKEGAAAPGTSPSSPPRVGPARRPAATMQTWTKSRRRGRVGATALMRGRNCVNAVSITVHRCVLSSIYTLCII